MNKIPKCRSKYYIPQANNIKVSTREGNKESLAHKITQKNLKFTSSRQFGKDITNSSKGSIRTIYNNHDAKIVSIGDKKTNYNIYIKKHSSASQISNKTQKIKITINNERKLRENKSGSMISKKNDDSASENYYKNNNLKNNYGPHPYGSKLHSSVSFGINPNNRVLSGNNSISVRLSNPKNNQIQNHLNNKSINLNNNIGKENVNSNIKIDNPNLDLM